VKSAKRNIAEYCIPELNKRCAAISQAGQSGSLRQPYKGRDIWKILEFVKIKTPQGLSKNLPHETDFVYVD
jgi:hypothetical protein